MWSLRSDTRQLLQESTEIHQCAVTFYEKLFRMEFRERPEVAQTFYNGHPKTPVEANAELEAQISPEELQVALQSLESSKAPGIDGLPADFYKTFWLVIGEDISLVIRDSLSKGHLPLSCRRVFSPFSPRGETFRRSRTGGQWLYSAQTTSFCPRC